MKLFLDTEFNGFGGELISMALVSLGGKKEFYEVLGCRSPVPWVKDNIIPILGKDPVSYAHFKELLYNFLVNCSHMVEIPENLKQEASIEIYADWPDDIKLLMEALLLGPGTMMGLSCKINLHLDRSLGKYTSKIPHNALSDARGIRDLYREKNDFPPLTRED